MNDNIVFEIPKDVIDEEPPMTMSALSIVGELKAGKDVLASMTYTKNGNMIYSMGGFSYEEVEEEGVITFLTCSFENGDEFTINLGM